MSKRNFILLVIVLGIIIISVFLFLFRQKVTTPSTSTNGGTNFVSNNFPSETGNTTSSPTDTPPADVSGSTPDTTPEAAAKLKKISSMPIAGFIAYTKERLKDIPVPEITPDATTSTTTPTPTTKTKTATKTAAPLTEFVTALKYVARSSGNIYETFADRVEEQKFSQTVIPKVYDAYFGSKGDSVIMRYLKADAKTIEAFAGSTPKEYLGTAIDGTTEVKGAFLPDDVKDLSISPDGGSVFYLFNSSDGNSMVGTILNFSTNKKTQIFSSPFTEWLSQWPSSSTITLTTKPAASVPGYMYKMDTGGKNMTKVIGGINGLTTLTSPNGKLVLAGDNNLSMNIYHTDTGIASPLGVRTMPEKCVWGSANDVVYCAVPKAIPAGQYPDSWYQGEVSFSDQLWKIDVATGNGTLLLDPATAPGGEDIDGIKLALDVGGNYLFFVNKKDSFLWEFQLK